MALVLIAACAAVDSGETPGEFATFSPKGEEGSAPTRSATQPEDTQALTDFFGKLSGEDRDSQAREQQLERLFIRATREDENRRAAFARAWEQTLEKLEATCRSFELECPRDILLSPSLLRQQSLKENLGRLRDFPRFSVAFTSEVETFFTSVGFDTFRIDPDPECKDGTQCRSLFALTRLQGVLQDLTGLVSSQGIHVEFYVDPLLEILKGQLGRRLNRSIVVGLLAIDDLQADFLPTPIHEVVHLAVGAATYDTSPWLAQLDIRRFEAGQDPHGLLAYDVESAYVRWIKSRLDLSTWPNSVRSRVEPLHDPNLLSRLAALDRRVVGDPLRTAALILWAAGDRQVADIEGSSIVIRDSRIEITAEPPHVTLKLTPQTSLRLRLKPTQKIFTSEGLSEASVSGLLDHVCTVGRHPYVQASIGPSACPAD